MTLLTPWALVWLASVPALVWLWRFAATRRQVPIPSLIPFERLLARPPKRVSRVVVNLLFWLQLAALIALALALAQPVMFQPRAKTLLAVLDTSASMAAGPRGAEAFEEGRQALLWRIAKKAPTEQVFIMRTAPGGPLTPQPTSDAVSLLQAVREAQASHLGGSLATAVRIGLALLGDDPDELLVVTDEAQPGAGVDAPVRWITVGRPLGNVALVGLDAQGPLCLPAAARLLVTVQNFSRGPASVLVRAGDAARASVALNAGARRVVALALPEAASDMVPVTVQAGSDGLSVDNTAWVPLQQQALLPVVVRSDDPAFVRTVSGWLGACEALPWSLDAPPRDGPMLLVTNDERQVVPAAAAALVFDARASGPSVPRHWLVSTDHPIGAYLNPVGVVSAALASTPAPTLTGLVWGPAPSANGLPMVSALIGGAQWPVVVAEEQERRRTVVIRVDPSASPPSTPLLLAFFNSLRWLMGPAALQTTGEVVSLSGGFEPGAVTVHRPDGRAEAIDSRGGVIRYDETTVAGLYRFVQAGRELTAAVNFLDPLESNLLSRASTWQPLPVTRAGAEPLRRVPHPLFSLLAVLILLLLLVEWWFYTRPTAPVRLFRR